MIISTKPFGSLPDKSQVTLYTLTNTNGLKAEIIDYGGIIVSIKVPDRDGKLADIALGYDKLEDYIDRSPFFGALIGRYANRIEKAQFTLDSFQYMLNNNEGKNHLHGGLQGFDKKLWDSRILSENGQESLELSLFSPDGDECYPGNLEVRVIYRLNDFDELEIEYYAASDKNTVLNLTNHCYFNLSGHDSGSILDHEIKIYADFYTPINSELLPTGEILSVKNTPFDFTQSKSISDGLSSYPDDQQIIYGSGYDHNFVLNDYTNIPKECCRVYDPKSGRLMICLTTMPGIQFYTGNFLQSAGIGKDGIRYGNRHGLCLETQYFPNSMKHKHFPNPVLAAGQTYHHKTVYRFCTR